MKEFRKIATISFTAGLLAFVAVAQGQSRGVRHHESSDSIPYATLQHISNSDSAAVVAEKAAKVLPRPNQMAWMRLERTFFIHFGPNTFRGVEWGNGREDPAIFNPTHLNADQWIRAVKNAGGKEVILVCKHHDGFALWPTRYTKHSIAASPWRGGKGDLVREVAKAARKYGVDLGVYLSPADLYQLTTNPKNPGGYYGDGSKTVKSVIPTDPATFKTNPAMGRKPPRGFRSYTYDVDDYNRYFMNQLYELLTQYGPIHEVWFDGANPDPRVHETYDYRAWYNLIRHLQPQAVIAVKGPDVRWVGNEGGVGRKTSWSVIPLQAPPDQFRWPDMTAHDLGSLSRLTPGSYLWWYPAEVNTPILYGWFWSPTKRVKTAADLVNLYYQSVGRNANMLLNLSPDTRGLIPDNQLASLRLMAQVLRETFDRNLAAGARLTADSSSPGHKPSLALDGNSETWWQAARGRTTATLTLILPKQVTFDVVSLQEAVDQRGQRISSFDVDVWKGSGWERMDEETTVGHKRLLRWHAPVTTDRVRIRITGSRLEPTLSEIGLFRQARLTRAPIISERAVDGTVTISSPRGLAVVYTLDGNIPTRTSAIYHSSLSLPRGGTVYAACVGPDGRLGMLASRVFSGFAPDGWTIATVSSENAKAPAANAIDGNAATIWESQATPSAAPPQEITVDMGRMHRIAGFSYLPRRDGSREGIVDEYRLQTSTDERNWKTVVESGRFGNMENNPELQEVRFPPVEARFFRFTALHTLGGDGRTSAAEISVLPASGSRER